MICRLSFFFIKDLGGGLGFRFRHSLPDLETAYAKVMQAFIERDILFAPGASVAVFTVNFLSVDIFINRM